VSDEQSPPDRAPEATLSRPLLQATLDRAGHLGFVAHEVRNPLSTALWSAELLGRLRPEERAGERGLKLATLGTRALTRLQGLVEDHLLCERLDAGGYPLRLGPVDLGALLEAVLQKLRLDPAPVVSLEQGLGGQGDRALLERALEGLVAVAAREGAAVRIGARRAGGTVRFTVQGAPVMSLEDPVRGSPSDPTGRALSLPLARRVAAVLGGGMTAQGSEYLLVIPAT
jgi:signal transduction histidine kinase